MTLYSVRGYDTDKFEVFIHLSLDFEYIYIFTYIFQVLKINIYRKNLAGLSSLWVVPRVTFTPWHWSGAKRGVGLVASNMTAPLR